MSESWKDWSADGLNHEVIGARITDGRTSAVRWQVTCIVDDPGGGWGDTTDVPMDTLIEATRRAGWKVEPPEWGEA